MNKKKASGKIWKEILIDMYENNPEVWFEKNHKNNTNKIYYAKHWEEKFNFKWEDLLVECNQLERMGYLKCPHTKAGGRIQMDPNKDKHIFYLTKEGTKIATELQNQRVNSRNQNLIIGVNIVLAVLTLFMVIGIFMQVNENSKLTELTNEQLSNQYDPEIYIKIDTPKKPWVYTPDKSFLSPYISLSLRDRYKTDYSNGTIITNDAWMIPIKFTIYNLKPTPLIFEDIYLYNNCIKNDRIGPLKNYILKDKVKDRIIIQDKPLNITPLYGVDIEVSPLLEIEGGKAVSNEECEIIFEFKFNNYSKNVTEYIRLSP